jgi:hypothetical protein
MYVHFVDLYNYNQTCILRVKLDTEAEIKLKIVQGTNLRNQSLASYCMLALVRSTRLVRVVLSVQGIA